MTDPDYTLLKSQFIALVDNETDALDRFSAADQAGVELLCAAYCELLSGNKDFI